MRRVERHPQVDADVDDALAHTLREFGPRQVPVYADLIIEGLKAIRHQPTIGRSREDVGPGIRVYAVSVSRHGCCECFAARPRE